MNNIVVKSAKDIETIISGSNIPSSIKNPVYYAEFDIDFLLKANNLENYMDFTDSFIENLAATIKSHGQLQSIAGNYSSDDQTFSKIDGRKRLLAIKLAGKQTAGVTFGKDLSKERQAELKLDLNKRKTNISFSDVAASVERVDDLTNNSLNHTQMSEFIFRTPQTISKYRKFNAFPLKAKQHAKNHPELYLASKCADIATKIKDPDLHEEVYFTYFKKSVYEANRKEELSKRFEKKTISFDELLELDGLNKSKKVRFNNVINSFNSVSLFSNNSSNKKPLKTKPSFKSQFSTSDVNDAVRFVNGLQSIAKLSSDLDSKLNGSASEVNLLIDNLINSYVDSLNQQSSKIKSSVSSYVSKLNETKLERYLNVFNSVSAGVANEGSAFLGDAPKYYSIDSVDVDNNQVRTSYDYKKVHELATHIAEHGQFEAGSIRPVFDDGTPIWKDTVLPDGFTPSKFVTIFGNQRKMACDISKISHYLASYYVPENELEVVYLQVIEDLCEHGTIVDESRVFKEAFDLYSQNKSDSYSIADFEKETTLLVTKKERELLHISQLPGDLEHALDQGLVSKDQAFLMQDLETRNILTREGRFELLCNSLTKRLSKSQLDSSLNIIKSYSSNSLMDVPISFGSLVNAFKDTLSVAYNGNLANAPSLGIRAYKPLARLTNALANYRGIDLGNMIHTSTQ